jgi:hypothetical protein
MPVRRVRFFENYRDAIGKIERQTKFETFIMASEFRRILNRQLIRNSPVGEESYPGPEDVYYPDRDSERTGRPSTIWGGWFTRIETTRRASSVVVDHADVERVDWLRFGTKAHPISASPGKKLFFWWGPPKRGNPPPVGSKYGGSGFRHIPAVNHPGITPYKHYTHIRPEFVGPGKIGQPGDFVMVAMSRAADEYENKFKEAIPRIIQPLRRLFRGTGYG